MTIELDHCIVSARDQVASARLLAQLLGVPWAESGVGPFSPVFVNPGLTLDFITDPGPFPVEHFCFRVTPPEFDAILGRLQAAGIGYRSAVRGDSDRRVSTQFGGRLVYWNEPDGHQWEMLTVSYARAAGPPATG
jgi:catechol 2,3-dioxygenase-like lactoylglutathione lyase family enzyme